jgi:hypothetical protein
MKDTKNGCFTLGIWKGKPEIRDISLFSEEHHRTIGFQKNFPIILSTLWLENLSPFTRKIWDPLTKTL